MHHLSTIFLLPFPLPLFVYVGVFFILSPPIAHAAGNTYYVATNGSDSNLCTQSSPCRTIRHGITRLTAGDTLRLRGGRYKETVNWNPSSYPDMPSGGTSWDKVITVESAPGERAEWYATGSGVLGIGGSIKYVVIRNITFDGSTGTNTLHVQINQPPWGDRYTQLPVTWAERIWPTGCDQRTLCPKFIRFEGNEARYAAYGVAGAQHDSFEYIHNYIHHIGKGLGVAFYVAGPDTLFDGNVFDTLSSTAINFWCQGCPWVHNGIARNNIFRNVGIVWAPQSENGNHPQQGGPRYAPGYIVSGNPSIFVSQGDNTQVYNNIMINSGGITVSQGSTNAKVYNNTIYGNPIGESGQDYDPQFDAGISLPSAFGSATKAVVRNNIVYQPGVTNPPPIYNGGKNTTLSSNLCSSTSPGCTPNRVGNR